MPKFIVEETVPSYVTWRYTIEAKDAEEAREIFAEGGWGEGEQEGPFIGDAVDFLDIELNIKAVGEEG